MSHVLYSTLMDVEVKAEEHATNLRVPAGFQELLKEARLNFSVLKDAMYPVRSLHNMDFLNFVEDHEKDDLQSIVKPHTSYWRAQLMTFAVFVPSNWITTNSPGKM